MAISEAIKKLFEEAGLSEEEMAGATAAFDNEKLQKAIEQGTMRQATFTRKAGELDAEKKRLQDNWDKANAEYIRMQSDYGTTQTERDEAKKKLEEAEKKLAAQPQIDPSKYMTTEQFEARQREFAAGTTAYFGDALEAQDQILTLTGSRVSAKQILQDSIAAKKTPLEYAEEKYGLATKREEKRVADEKKHDEEVERRGYERALAEAANPQSRTLDASKDPMYVPTGEGAKNPWDEQETPASEQALLSELQKAKFGA